MSYYHNKKYFLFKLTSLAFIVLFINQSCLEANKKTNIKKPLFLKSLTFKGTATPITTMTITHGFNTVFRGEIAYTARPGFIFQGATYDSKGNITKKGNLLFKFDTTSREKIVALEKASLDQANVNLNLAKEKYLRYKELYSKLATSLEKFQEKESAYYKAIYSFKQADLKLYLAKIMLKNCFYYAKFDGIVNEVLVPSGWVGGELAIMNVSQLFPMGIKVKMSRKQANMINISTPVKIFPPVGGKPMGIDYTSRKLTEDGIIFYVNNYPDAPISGNKNILVINSTCTVFYFDQLQKDSPLCVNTKSLQKDKKGYYVWQAAGQKNCSPDNGINHIFKVNKIYVTPGNKISNTEPGVTFVNLKNSSISSQNI